jgi:hypothetical protein
VSSAEVRSPQPETVIVPTNAKVVEQLPSLSEAAGEYLLELAETLDPSEAYEIVYPAGHQYGYAGLSAEYPALSSTGVIESLRWIFQHAQLQSVKECQRYVIQPLEDPLGIITQRYVVDSDGRTRKVTVPQRLHPPSKVT